jgi:hypothetical protein
VFLLQYRLPADFRYILEGTADSLMPQLPSYSLENGIGIWHWGQLKLWRWWEFKIRKNRSFVSLVPCILYGCEIIPALALFSGYFSHSMYPFHPSFSSANSTFGSIPFLFPSGCLLSMDSKVSISLSPIPPSRGANPCSNFHSSGR